MSNFNFDVGSRIAQIGNSVMPKVGELVQDKAGELLGNAFGYASPKKVDFVPPVEPIENPVETVREPLPITPTYDKLTLNDLRQKAENKRDVWAELISTFDVACRLGVAFLSLEKGDREFIRRWDSEIRANGDSIALPPNYYEIKDRIDSFDMQCKTIKITQIPDSVKDMLYEGFLFDYKKQNEKGTVQEYNGWQSIINSLLIVLGSSIKQAVFVALMKSINRYNAG